MTRAEADQILKNSIELMCADRNADGIRGLTPSEIKTIHTLCQTFWLAGRRYQLESDRDGILGNNAEPIIEQSEDDPRLDR